MTRKLRLEYEGACYHILNRGNYRAPIFAEDGAKRAFLKCLDEAVIRSNWVIHAWCIMSNHYHLALETPKGNLVEGMRWLQVTFAVRFNRLRRENGHLFQGRYKSLIVEPGDHLGALCHYIHLNPVRAQVVAMSELATHSWCSARWIARREERKAWFCATESLRHAGDLADSMEGRRQYFQYLAWLAENDHEARRRKFDQMSRGWAIGSRCFKQALCNEHTKLSISLRRGTLELETTKEEDRAAALASLLQCVKKGPDDIARDPKGAPWKIAVATEMKRRTTASNPWLSRRLNMGSRHRLSRLVNACSRNPGDAEPFLLRCAQCKI